MRTPVAILAVLISCVAAARAFPQRIQFPPPGNSFQPNGGLRPIDRPATGNVGGLVPINPATQSGIYPSTGLGSPTFDPYGNSSVWGSPTSVPVLPPQSGFAGPGFPSTNSQLPGTLYNGPSPLLPGTGQSAIVGTFPNTAPTYGQPGIYPNNTPSALFPGAYPNQASGGSGPFGGFFSNMYDGLFGNPNSTYGYNAPPVLPPAGPYGQNPYQGNLYSQWNPQGAVFTGTGGYPGFVRFFQGPRFRHAYIHGNDAEDSLMINDSDVSLAFAIPNFFYSTQPLYLLPSFSLHQWDGPQPPSTADLPALAYSAFLDLGWQSDPARILGAELGARVGMFTDFDTANGDSLRVMGRGIGRLRITPRATVKLGVLYLDRNRVKLLPAGGLLWQPNPETRFDLFFPEPKLAHYLSTVGNLDTWWYVGGYYGGGSWTVRRSDSTTDSIDINDIRLVLGLEWGRNEQMREGRRYGFIEVGYVFERELLYKFSPADSLDLQDSFMVRAGFGY